MIHSSMKMLSAGFAVILLSAAIARADEVDDLLALKARNRDRVKHFAAEFTVETDQLRSVPGAKTVHVRYQLNLRRLPPGQVKHPGLPWFAEINILEPGRSSIRIEGDAIEIQGPSGNWQAVALSPDQRRQMTSLVEPFTGMTPSEHRRNFTMTILRRNNPIFGPKTVTLESIPNGRERFFSKMEEDTRADGLVLATRFFNERGQETSRLRVTRSRTVNGIPVMEGMEAVSVTPAGDVVSRTTCTNVLVETQP